MTFDIWRYEIIHDKSCLWIVSFAYKLSSWIFMKRLLFKHVCSSRLSYFLNDFYQPLNFLCIFYFATCMLIQVKLCMLFGLFCFKSSDVTVICPFPRLSIFGRRSTCSWPPPPTAIIIYNHNRETDSFWKSSDLNLRIQYSISI